MAEPTCPSCGGVLSCAACAAAAAPTGSAEQTSAQAATGRDSRADDRDQAAELRDRDAETRDDLARRDSLRASDLDQIASDQAERLSNLEEDASRRDQESADGDQRAADADLAAGGDAAHHARGMRARAQSRHDRDVVWVLREQTASARLQEDKQDESREDGLRVAERSRLDAADDRREGALDRADALRNRAESADAERRAVETLESMSDAFFTLDSEWRFTYLNPQTEVILERRRDELLGKNMWDEFPGGIGSRFDDGYRLAVREQVPVRFEAEYEPLGRTLEVRAFPVADGLAVYFSDVTADRLQQERLGQAQRLEAIGRATAGIAHDFGNLLAVVRGFAQLGQRSSADDKTGSYFGEIDSAGQKAGELARQLLAFARRQELAPTVIDLNDVAEGLSSLLRQVLPGRVELCFALARHPVPVFVDRPQLEQVLVNLIINAGDSIDTAGTVTISTATEDPIRGPHDGRESPSGWLQVADTGCGIPPEVLPQIFDPFFSTKPPETGTGLGLATSYGIISQSGGEILVHSRTGVGTTMTVVLPASEPSSPSPMAEAEAAAAA